MSRIALSLLALLIPSAAGLLRSLKQGPLDLGPKRKEAQTSVVVWKRQQSSLSKIFDRDKYVVLGVFCGRRDRMQLLLKHATNLLNKGEIDEIHLHVMNQKTAEDDKVWINEQADKEKDITSYSPSNFKDPYDFYANDFKPLKKFEGKTVVVKADDDVVYIDEANFGKFTDYILDHPDMFLVFANTVNNGVAAYYQQQHGAIPQESNGVDMKMEYPLCKEGCFYNAEGGVPGLRGSLWESAAKTTELHNVFLKDPESFSWKAEENDGCIAYHHPDQSGTQGRFSVNFFGWSQDKSGQIADLARGSSNPEDDEFGLTVENPNQNCMFTEFVVSHLSFFKQQDNGMNADEVIKKYADHLGFTLGL